MPQKRWVLYADGQHLLKGEIALDTIRDKMDAGARAYFDSLPAVFQEQIMQSGVEMTSKEQMESYCRNVLAENLNK